MAGGTLVVRLVGDTREFDRAFKGVGARIKGFNALLGVSAGLVVRDVGRMALAFDSSFTRIDAISNASAQDIAKWKDQVLALSGETARAPEELADALFFLSSAGLKSSQVMETLEMSAKAAASGLGSTIDIAKLTANALNAYAEAGLTAEQATDTLVAAVREGSAEPEEFAEALGRILPIASKAQVGFDEVTASLAALSNIGLDVNEGTTAMRSLMAAIVAPTKQAQDAMAELGLSTDQLRQVLAEEGLIATLRLLEQRTGGNIDQMKALVPNIRALTGAFGLTAQEAEKVDAIFANVADSAGSLGEAFATTAESDSFKFRQALNDLSVSALKFGSSVLPLVVDALRVIVPVLAAVAENAGIVLTAFLAYKVLPVLLAQVSMAFGAAGLAASASTPMLMAFAAAIGGIILALRNMHTALRGVSSDPAFQDLIDATDGYNGKVDAMNRALQDSPFALSATASGMSDLVFEAKAATVSVGAFSKLLGTDMLAALDTTSEELRENFKEAVKEGRVATLDFIQDTQGAFIEWRDDIARNLNFVVGAFDELAAKDKLTADQLLRGMEKALRAQKEFGENLLTIRRVGGEAAEGLVSRLAEMGEAGANAAEVIASSGKAKVREFVEAWNSGAGQAQNTATRISNQIVGSLSDIRDVLVAIAREWGIDIALKGTQDTLNSIAAVKSALASLPAGVNVQMGVIKAEAAASGFHGEVTKPTLILAGEAGWERVDITPGGAKPAPASSGPTNVFDFRGAVFNGPVDEQSVEEAFDRLTRRWERV